MSDKIQVAYCFDDNMALPGAVAILSLLRSNPQDVQLHICTDPEPKCASLLHAIADAEGVELRIIDKAPEKSANLDAGSDYGIESTACYRRVYLPELLTDLGRVIYIDADTFVPTSLRPLWEMDLQGNAVGAVRDPWMITNDLIKAQLPGGYFNAGVLLLDLGTWVERGITTGALREISRLREEAEKYGGSALDYRFEQTPLNFACAGQWKEISPRWNYATMFTPRIAQSMGIDPENYDSIYGDLGIVHMLGGHKPWVEGFESISHWHKLFHQCRLEIETRFDTTGLAWPGAFTNGRSAEISRRLMAMRLVQAAKSKGWDRPAVVLTGLLGPEIAKVAREQGFPIDCFITEYPALVGHHAHGIPIIGFAEAFAAGKLQVIVGDYRRLERTMGVLKEEAAGQDSNPELLTLHDC